MEEFLRIHQPQLESANVPRHLWPILHHKLKNEVFNAGGSFFLARDERGDLHAVVRDDVDISGVQPNAESALFLIDHAWTFTSDTCKQQLETMPMLLDRLERLMQLPSAASSTQTIAGVQPEVGEEVPDLQPRSMKLRMRDVLERVWRYANTYQLSGVQSDDGDSDQPATPTPIWYVMDEFGSAIEHSDKPNVRMAPFYFANTQCAFSLMWIVAPLEAGDFLTRDYVPQAAHDLDMHTALLAALFYNPPLKNVTPEVNMAEPHDEGEAGRDYYAELQQIVTRRQQQSTLETSLARFDTVVGRDSETLPDPQLAASNPYLAVAIAGAEPLRLSTNLLLIQSQLKHDKIAFVDDENEAQILWPTRHLKDYASLCANEKVLVINQFPNEKILTCKDLLYEMCRLQNGGTRPRWLAPTYNMVSELPELVAEYIRRDQLNLASAPANADESALPINNRWICKPWNLARSLDTSIAKSAMHLARLTETGPKIASQYIRRPVLLGGCKFDLRFIVLLTSTSPLEVYLSNVSWLRLANKSFAMDEFDDFERHFTVMKYSPNEYDVRFMTSEQLEAQFNQEYPSTSWQRVREQVARSIKELFTFATNQPPPRGLGRCSKSRALYGVDVMLEWSEEVGEEGQMKPVILEVNFQPDCTRACEEFPHFFQDAFNVLVFNRPEDTVHGVDKL